jgi:hypothetical protein
MSPTRNRNSCSQVWAATTHPPNVTAKAAMAGQVLSFFCSVASCLRPTMSGARVMNVPTPGRPAAMPRNSSSR